MGEAATLDDARELARRSMNHPVHGRHVEHHIHRSTGGIVLRALRDSRGRVHFVADEAGESPPAPRSTEVTS